MLKHIIILSLAGIILIPAVSDAQRWKRLRYETIYGIGATNFLGELGGANQIGTDYLRDLEISMTRFVLQVGVRYRMTKSLACKASLSYGMLSGNDNTTKEFSRQYRNLSFRSMIIELAVQLEPAIIKETAGHRYRLRGVKGKKWMAVNTYPIIGISVFYFNPKAKYNGKWYALQPLATEGQGQFPTRKRKYSRFGISIPIGFGFKYGYNRRWSVGLEYGMRKTFTDYMDDVSTTYVDPEYIRSASGGVNSDIAIALADRSNGDEPSKTAPGQQRGDPTDNDAYMFAIISLNYKFRMVKRRRRSRPKF